MEEMAQQSVLEPNLGSPQQPPRRKEEFDGDVPGEKLSEKEDGGETTDKQISELPEDNSPPLSWEQIVRDSVINPPVDQVYEFEDIIGTGSFSDVVLGVQLTTGKKYAIKIIDKAKIDTAKRKQRVLTEIDILRECDHPYIVKVHQIYESHLDICLVLDLMEGGELFDAIVRNQKFSEADARRIIRQMCLGLDYLHDKGICHRDLKPENMLCSSKDPKKTDICITDFGLAKFGKDSLATPCGSVNYVAPEIVANEIYDNGVDMWALGCVMYFVLFGKPPFHGEDDEEIMDLVEEGLYEFPADPDSLLVSGCAKELIRHLLEKDPAIRYTTKQTLKHAWFTPEKPTAEAATEEVEEEEEEEELDRPGATKQDQELTMDKRQTLRSSMNKAIDVQRDGLFFKTPLESTIAQRRKASAAAAASTTTSTANRFLHI
ncbi:Serine/threonine-protein kinase dclk3 [Balamuthia mandrillaris]